MSIHVEPPDSEYLPTHWTFTFSCGACVLERRRHIQVPVGVQHLRAGEAPEHLAFGFVRNIGWQIEPTRCPEHAGVLTDV